MSVFNLHQGVVAGAAAGGGAAFDTTLIGNSVWLDGTADYFSRTYAGSGNPTTEGIFSFWYQRYSFGVAQQQWFEASGFGGLQTNASYGGGDTIVVNSFTAGGAQLIARHTRLLRDTSWYHIIVSIDMSQATTLDKIKFYINGEQDTTINVQNLATTNGLDMLGARSKVNFRIGENPGSTGHAFAQYCYLDGVSIQQGDYAVSDFLDTFTFGTNGSQIIPKANADIAALASTVGGNSICLDFADSADLGNDISSNANDFTPTSMSSVNQTTNTPSLVFPTFSALNISSLTSLSEGNLKAVGSGSEVSGVWSTRPISAGETIYFEGTWGSTSGWGYFGVSSKSYHSEVTSTFNSDSSTHIFQLTPTASNRGVASAGSALFTGKTAWTTTDTFQIAIDINNGKLWFGVNDSWYDSGGTTTGDPAAGTNPTVTFAAETPMFVVAQSGGASSINVNFGQDSQNVSTGNADENGYGDFEFAPPSGFLAFCSANLTAPDYQGIDYFNATLYTGDGTAIGSGGKAVTGVGFQPDFTWIKNRDAADSHILTDVVRGVTKYISSNSTAAEVTNTESLSTFDTDGFTVGNLAAVNTNTEDYVSWNWLAGGTGSSNTDGSITSTVTVADAGHFSIGTYTGTGAAGTVGHGLTGAAEWYAVKNLTDVTAWLVGSAFINGDQFLELQSTKAVTTNADKFSNYASATVLNIGNNNEVNGLSDSMSFMAFRSVPGVCKVGSYIGNGNADGPHVSVGFSPKWVMVKPVNAANPWTITDTSRDPINATTRRLHPNLSQAEAADSLTCGDILADGFKLRASHGNVNQSGITYLYLAMANIAGGGTLPPIYAR